MDKMTKRYFVITDQMREDAKEAMIAVYGSKSGYTPSDDDIEMMEEYHAIKLHNANTKRNAEMKEASEKRGVEW